ncbi:helix-turn-helix domain-containing protein [Rhizobium sp. BR 315]|uniref:helix-turn-helix domain-containing protein n=1 Tax=Rhizobium sp. BR 315 TaxID=3040014 RepID=UPI003D34D758
MKDAQEARGRADFRDIASELTERYVFDMIPESGSARKATMRGSAIYSVRSAGSQKFPASEHSVGIVLATARKLRASRGSDRIKEYDAPVGCIAISPAGVDDSLAWLATRKNLVVAIPPEILAELAVHEFDGTDVELEPPAFGTVDLWVLDIAKRVCAELTGDVAPNELYLDSLVTLFGVHLLRTYTSRKRPSVSLKGGLSPGGARRVREYLSEHFTQKTNVAELASVAGISPNHFIVRFARTFGTPPNRYLINLRLDFAEKLLVEGELAIAEVAYMAGFSDQSHLTATMKRYRGKTPTELRFRG